MTGELFINGHDAWTRWGISLDSSGLAALMTPASLKEFVSNESRLEHGRQYIATHPKLKERELTLRLNLYAPTAALFYARYNAFCTDVLATGTVDISTRYQSGLVYHCLYQSCTQYTQYRGKIAKFALKLTESDPSNRDA
ncbi:MAG: hypothetical protein IKG99_10555 [Bacteroidaceae bacterium]|nr:hypothetical protein [Bacteroidaceae bacterium]